MFVNINVTPCDGTEKLLWRKMVNEEASGRSMLHKFLQWYLQTPNMSVNKKIRTPSAFQTQTDGTKSQDIAPRVGKKKLKSNYVCAAVINLT
jgi:hypothetical protein